MTTNIIEITSTYQVINHVVLVKGFIFWIYSLVVFLSHVLFQHIIVFEFLITVYTSQSETNNNVQLHMQKSGRKMEQNRLDIHSKQKGVSMFSLLCYILQ